MNKSSSIKEVVLIGLLMLSFSCSREGKEYDHTSKNIALEATGETSVLNAFEREDGLVTKKNNIHADLKIIRNANCRIMVNDLHKITSLAKKIAITYNGYVSDERLTNTNYNKENRFTIRVPQEKFDRVLDSICSLAEFVDHKNISTLDVTEEYIDITARLKTKLEVKARYENVLRKNATTVEDILKTEDKLRLIQEEIEVAQGRLNYLSNKVGFSTIQIDMYETVIPKDEPKKYQPNFFDKAKNGLSFGWSMIENLMLVLFYIWPLITLGILVLVYFKRMRK